MVNAIQRLSLIFAVSLVLLLKMTAGETSAEISSALLSDLQSNDYRVRVSAVEQLGKIRNEEAFAILTNIVARKEEYWRVRIKAIHIIGKIADPRSSDLLINVFANPFLNEECPSLKWTTALALGNFKNDSRVIEVLIGALDYDNILIREAAIQSLGNIGASSAVPLLIKALNDKSFAVRANAITALGKIGSSEAIPYLEKAAEIADDPVIKSKAILALKALKQS